MKFNKPRYSGYKNVHYGTGEGGKFASLPKLARIAIIIVAAILALAIVFFSVVAIINAVKAKKLEKFKAEMKEIQIVQYPNKRTYYCGSDFDKTGLIVCTVTNGGDFTELNLDVCEITGFDSSVPVAEQTITVTYKGFTDTFTVEIKAEPTAAPVLVSIAMKDLPKTQYKVNQGLRTNGGTFVCTYSDGSTKTVDLINEYIYGFRDAYLAGVGEYDITVKYEENGVQVETTYKITITE